MILCKVTQALCVMILFCVTTGCDDATRITHLKCRDGVVYVMDGGIWIEAKLYSGNKCFSDKPDTLSKSAKETK